MLDARSTAANYAHMALVPGDMWFIPDGGKQGHEFKIKSQFRDEANDQEIKKVHKKMTIQRMETGITARRNITRKSAATIKQNETVHLITSDRIRLPQAKRKHFSGTNLGNTISEVPVPPFADLWHLPTEKKRELYDKYRVAVGGRDSSSDEDDEDDAESAAEQPLRKRRKADAVETEPVFYTELPHALCDEIQHMFKVPGIIDLTAGPGTWARIAIEHRLQYFGLTLTDCHMKELQNKLVKDLAAQMKAAPLPAVEPSETSNTQKPAKEKTKKKSRRTGSKKDKKKEKTASASPADSSSSS